MPQSKAAAVRVTRNDAASDGDGSSGGARRAPTLFPDSSGALPAQRWQTLHLSGHADPGVSLELAKLRFGTAVGEALARLAAAGHLPLPAAGAIWTPRPNHLRIRLSVPPALRPALETRMLPNGLLPVSGVRGGFVQAAWPDDGGTLLFRLINTPSDLSMEWVQSVLTSAGCSVVRVRHAHNPLAPTLPDASKLEIELRCQPRQVPAGLGLTLPDGAKHFMRLDLVQPDLPSVTAMQLLAKQRTPAAGSGGGAAQNTPPPRTTHPSPPPTAGNLRAAAPPAAGQPSQAAANSKQTAALRAKMAALKDKQPKPAASPAQPAVQPPGQQEVTAANTTPPGDQPTSVPAAVPPAPATTASASAAPPDPSTSAGQPAQDAADPPPANSDVHMSGHPHTALGKHPDDPPSPSTSPPPAHRRRPADGCDVTDGTAD